MDNSNEEQINQQMITVPAINIITKLRTKVDRQNFCRENSKSNLFNIYTGLFRFPNQVMNIIFMLKELKGEKK